MSLCWASDSREAPDAKGLNVVLPQRAAAFVAWAI